MEVEGITIQYLEDYLDDQFFDNNQTIVDYYVSNIVENKTAPPSIVYDFGVAFTNLTTFIPSQQEVDVLIESAFLTPAVNILISAMKQIGTENPFSKTMSIIYVRQSNFGIIKDGRNRDDTNSTDTNTLLDLTDAPIQIEDGNQTRYQTSPPVRLDDNFQSYDAMMLQYENSTIKVTPFSLTYTWSGHNDTNDTRLDPTIGETKAASNITLSFLDDYLHTMFDLGQPGRFNYFVGYGAGMIEERNVIGFRTGLQFHDTSMFTSIHKEVEMLIQTAFIPHYVEPLLNELRSKLPTRNPFSKTVAVTITFNNFEVQTSSKTLLTLRTVALALAFVLVLIAFILVVLYRHRRWNHVQRRNIPGIPKIIIHTNHDPIHGDLIEIISSGDPDDDDIDEVPRDSLSSVFSSMHQRLMSTFPAIDDTEERNRDIIGIHQHEQRRPQVAKPKLYSDEYSSTSSSTSVLSLPVRFKYTEPKIFEDVD
jgi:hypothetical protein